MANSYYTPQTDIVTGATSKVSDINDIDTAVDAGFDAAEVSVTTAIATGAANAQKSEDFAITTKNSVVPGEVAGTYSSLHWAAISQDNADAGAVATGADVVLTHADVVSTGADLLLTNADVVLTHADVVSTGNDVTATNADVVLTGIDLGLTNADVVSTNADVVLTHADVVLTHADVALTGADLALTNADVTAASGFANNSAASAATAASSVATAIDTYFPAGTKMPFYQAAPPTNWTAVSVNDSMLRVVTTATTGGTTGGSISPITMSHTHLDTITHASHVLTVGELPAHNHANGIYNALVTLAVLGYDGPIDASQTASAYDRGVASIATVGSGLGHSHTKSGSVTSSSFVPKYVDVVIASRNA